MNTASVRARLSRLLLPGTALVASLALWEIFTLLDNIPAYILPGPLDVMRALIDGWPSLAHSWVYTLKITLGALMLACAGGALIAFVFALMPSLERALTPWVITLQVTPIVAIAPLIMIYIDNTTAALLICAWIVAFFPILSNTLVGLRSIDPNLLDLFRLYGATPLQRLTLLRAPSALPYFLAGLKISGGLSLIGAVTAEMVAGVGGRNSGLASRIMEASFRMDIPRMYAALVLLVITGVIIYAIAIALTHLLVDPWFGEKNDTDNEPMNDAA